MASSTPGETATDPLGAAWRMLAQDVPLAEQMAGRIAADFPANPEALLLLGAARRRRGNIAGARDVLGRLAEARPHDAPTQFEWGVVLDAMGDAAGALQALRKAAAVRPDMRGPFQALADALVQSGDLPAASQAYANALRAGLAKTELAPLAAALAAGRAHAAEPALKARVRQHPNDALGVFLLAEAAIRVGRPREAAAVLAHCIDIAPGLREARHSLAVLLYVQDEWRDAAPHFAWLHEHDPHSFPVRRFLAACLARSGQFDASLPVYESLLADFAEDAKIWLFYGHALKTLGRADDAVRAYRTCLSLAPGAAEAFLSLADVKTALFTAPEKSAMRAQLANPRVQDDEKARLRYALGSALEQESHYAEAFEHYAAGARLRRQALTYDKTESSAEMRRLRAIFSADFFSSRRAGGNESTAPIFIVGLPRSGSTLLEHILASHSQVEGTMELTEMGKIAAELGGAEAVAALDSSARMALGDRFLARTAQFRHSGRPFFIDKTPDNFLRAGLIHLILPRAKIIDMRRAPMAAGLAMFKQYFQTGHEYSYDLAEIGQYYRAYEALMAHFDAVLPGRFYRLNYEELVLDPERQIRAVLAYCGLPFEPACLRHWETPRAVQTPSAQQVRRPISRDGIDHWRHFEAWLGPLQEALGPPLAG